MPLYHIAVGIPHKVVRELPQGWIFLFYSKHALLAAKQDGVGQLPDILHTALAQLIEVEADEDGLPLKIVYRLHMGDGRDLVLAVAPHCNSFRTWTVKTVWVNRSDDTHRTLRRERYFTSKERNSCFAL